MQFADKYDSQKKAELDLRSGAQVRELREALGLSQSQLAHIIGVSKSAVSLCEWQNRGIPSGWVEKLRLLREYSSLSATVPVARKRNWRFSKNFAQTPTFRDLPACPCANEKCRLDPEKDLARGDLHLWLFRGRECKKRRYVNDEGYVVLAPPSLRRKANVPVERCSLCGKTREVKTRTTAKYPGAIFYTLYCRGKASEHNPPTRYWRRDGKLEYVPPGVLASLSFRLNLGFEAPPCDLPECTCFGKRMEFSGRRGPNGTILVFRCRAPKKHVVFRGPLGEVAQKLGFSHFRWQDHKTGEIKEVRSRMGRKTDVPVVPHINCPIHEVGLQKFSGPSRNKRTRKVTWGLKCPFGGEHYYFDGDLRANKLPGRVKQGRPIRLTVATQVRIEKAANLEIQGLTKWKISAILYPKSERSAAYANTKKFLRRYRRLIDSKKLQRRHQLRRELTNQ